MSELERRLARAGRILDEASGLSPDVVADTAPGLPPRKPWVLAIAAALIVALGVGALVLQSRRGDETPLDEATSTSAAATTTSDSATTAPVPAPSGEGTLPATAPLPVTSASTAAEPATTTAARGGVLVASGVSPVPALGGDREDTASWALLGRFPGTALELRGSSYAPSGPCFAVRSPAERTGHTWCRIDPLAPYGAVPLDDGRIAVLVDTTGSRGRVTLTTSAGDVTTDGIPVPIATGQVWVAAFVVTSGTEILRVGSGGTACPIASLAAAANVGATPPVTIAAVRCTDRYASAVRAASAYVDQPDSVYFRQGSDGVWTVLASGGDPCLEVTPGSEVDRSNRTPPVQEKERAELAELKAACVALGDLPAS